MKRYIPLNPNQREAVSGLAGFFEPRSSTNSRLQPSEEKNESPRKYIPVSELLTDKQKQEIEEHENIVEHQFKNYSVY